MQEVGQAPQMKITPDKEYAHELDDVDRAQYLRAPCYQ
jgi:hypothetical protein